VIVGPEVPLSLGLVDALVKVKIPAYGPKADGARLEASKIFTKELLLKHKIPTAPAAFFSEVAPALAYLRTRAIPIVVKVDGLAAGKGVVVLDDAAEALALLETWFGSAGIPGGGRDVLLEERLTGREVSVFAIGDGRTLVPVAGACDYKRAGDGDTGPNTGGMGAYSPPSGLPADLHELVRTRVLEPVVRGLAEEGERYVGVLYCGLMWTDAGPKVIEFNVRFGDPETQVLMPRVRGDFAKYLYSAATGKLDTEAATFSDDACVGIVIATSDYPRSSTPLRDLPADVALGNGSAAFWGTSTLRDGVVDAGGGRVLTVTSLGPTVAQARTHAYDAVRALVRRFGARELSYRTDIAAGR
jgi:phosphoribosylamine--glycine ligase